ncbi:MAG: hypothetical protein ACKVKR_10460, partial [Pseudomonadales bacterium]
VPEDVGDYCLMRRPIVDVLNSMPESHRYIRGLRSWAGFRQTGIQFNREARHSGQSGFNLVRYLRFAFDGIFSFSHVPLVLSTYLGFIISSISFLVGFVFVVAKLMGLLPDIPGWTSVLVLILFTGGVQMLSVGILGQYIGRIYDEAKRRPPYIVSLIAYKAGSKKGCEYLLQVYLPVLAENWSRTSSVVGTRCGV